MKVIVIVLQKNPTIINTSQITEPGTSASAVIYKTNIEKFQKVLVGTTC